MTLSLNIISAASPISSQPAATPSGADEFSKQEQKANAENWATMRIVSRLGRCKHTYMAFDALDYAEIAIITRRRPSEKDAEFVTDMIEGMETGRALEVIRLARQKLSIQYRLKNLFNTIGIQVWASC